MPTDFEARVGKEFSLDCHEQGKVSCVVKEIVPQQKLVYSFRSQLTKVETLVTLTLAKEGQSDTPDAGSLGLGRAAARRTGRRGSIR